MRVLTLRGAEAVLHPCDWARAEDASVAASERVSENKTHLISVARLDNVAAVGSQASLPRSSPHHSQGLAVARTLAVASPALPAGVAASLPVCSRPGQEGPLLYGPARGYLSSRPYPRRPLPLAPDVQVTFAGEYIGGEPIPLMRFAMAQWTRYGVEEQPIFALRRREPYCKVKPSERPAEWRAA